MAYYTDVKLIVGRTVIGTSPRADVGLPGQHKLIVKNVTWKVPTRGPGNYLDYLQKQCTVKAKGPENTPVEAHYKITGIKGGYTVHLD